MGGGGAGAGYEFLSPYKISDFCYARKDECTIRNQYYSKDINRIVFRNSAHTNCAFLFILVQ